MIAKVTRGRDLGGLFRYLLGPTRDPANVHHDQRVIATSAGIDVPLGKPLTAPQRRHLAEQLDGPRRVFDVDVTGGHVWHLSLTNRADDRQLSDEDWADAVRATLARLGFDDDAGGQAPTPWAAVRHGRSAGGHDHVHLAVSLVREDGTQASVWQDRVKLSAACRELEQCYQLHVVDGRTAGTTPAPTRAEHEIAARTGATECDRTRLARLVRAAAAASRDEAEFVRRIRALGVRCRPRYATADPTRVVGYSVSTGGPDARWWGGGRLAKDLTLPALRLNWQPVNDESCAWQRVGHRPAHPPTDRERRAVPTTAVTSSIERVRQTRAALAGALPDAREAWEAAARGTAGIYAALAARFEPDGAGPFTESARSLARSAQATHWAPQHDASRLLAGIGTAVAQVSRPAGPSWENLLRELTRLGEAIAAAHLARRELDRSRQILAAISATAAQPTLARAERLEAAAQIAVATRLGGPERGVLVPVASQGL